MIAFTTINGRFHVESHGNGWGYSVTDQETGDNFWVQDESACQLQADTNNFEDEIAIESYFPCE